MDHFMEEVVVKHNRGVENTLYILSNIVMVLSALWALMCIQMLFMQFSIYGLIEALVTAGVAVLLFLRRDRLRTEYEYTFTNGDLDFAQVFNNQKRKTARHHARQECGGLRPGGFQRLPQADQHARAYAPQLVFEPWRKAVLFSIIRRKTRRPSSYWSPLPSWWR